MSTGTQQLLGRVHWPRRWALRFVVVLVAVAGTSVAVVGIMVAVDRIFFAEATQKVCQLQATHTSRPRLQRILDGVVVGPSTLAPGATAYVSGPHGSWSGAAGVADTSTCARMPVDARMRLESVTKIYTATLVLQLAQEGKLRVGDTVARWLPGLLPYGNRITIRQLLTMRSGLIDNNDLRNAPESVQRTYLGRVKDANLRAQLVATLARAEDDPAVVVPETFWIRWAAWQPLLFPPGAGRHYSNIGYDILGLIAARAGGEPLVRLYRERIFEPLGLHATAYDPQGPIKGPHARGYGIEPNGMQTDTTDWHWGVGAEGGIVSNAEDTATFLTALMRGELLDRTQLTAMEGENLWSGGDWASCPGLDASDAQAYGWSGGGSGYKTDVWVNDGGSRVAVLLLNARHYDTAQPAADQAAHDTLARLYCGA
ncbi:MAG TPA: serine hydrolase domain-containing protein [Gaiellaceae bacterium]|nr:serine hydrolase domain-containing protein [Gaiellaceae bacterium]